MGRLGTSAGFLFHDDLLHNLPLNNTHCTKKYIASASVEVASRMEKYRIPEEAAPEFSHQPVWIYDFNQFRCRLFCFAIFLHSGSSFNNVLVAIRKNSATSCIAELDLLRSQKLYEHVLAYVDDLLCISHDPKAIMDALS